MCEQPPRGGLVPLRGCFSLFSLKEMEAMIGLLGFDKELYFCIRSIGEMGYRNAKTYEHPFRRWFGHGDGRMKGKWVTYLIVDFAAVTGE